MTFASLALISFQGFRLKTSIKKFILLLAALFYFSNCGFQHSKHIEIVRTADMMSTFVTLTLVGTNELQLQKTADTTFSFMQDLSSKFNIYDSNSEVSRLNTAFPGKSIELSPELADVLHHAVTANKLTDGYFDITVRPLVLLWKEIKNKDILPSDETIRHARDLVGFSNLSILKSNLIIKKQGISVDLGGIAKAYILQNTVDKLKQNGIVSGIVNIGGDLYAWGERSNGKRWRIGIQHPRDKNAFLKILKLKNQAVLTSGDYERFFIRNGKRYSHIINPFTGIPDSDIISVTVITDDIMAADGLSAGLTAMGSKKALKKIIQLKKEIPGTKYLIVWIENGEIKHFSTFQ